MLSADNARPLTFVVGLALAASICIHPAAAQTSASSNLLLTVSAQCGVSVLSDVPDAAGRVVTFLYKIRTGRTGGRGEVAMQFVGPVADGGIVEYRTELAGAGTAISGSVPGSSAKNGIVVARFGERTGSTRAGDTGRVRYALSGPAMGATPPAAVTIACQ